MFNFKNNKQMSEQNPVKSGMSGFKPFIIIFVVLVVVMVLIKLVMSAIM